MASGYHFSESQRKGLVANPLPYHMPPSLWQYMPKVHTH